MNTAIIAEYNPFHNGHLYHLNCTKSITGADNIITLISGNYVQRGEPAIIDKVARTKMALMNGADLVLELPTEYATGSADVFARGAIELLNASGIVHSLCFGSEEGDISAFSDIADVLNEEPDEFKALLKSSLETGANYPTARALALSHYLNRDISFLNNPNNILALEYVRALKRTESTIWPYTLTREISDYNSAVLTGDISSASAIRAALLSDNENLQQSAYEAIPENCRSIMYSHRNKLHTIDDFSAAMQYILRFCPKELLPDYADVTEGLENRILNYMGTRSITELINIVKTKRYTYTKLQRAILHIVLGITKADQQRKPKYIRVLGFKKEKEGLLSELMQHSSLPVITNVKTMAELYEREIRATDLYYMAENGETSKEYTNPIVVE